VHTTDDLRVVSIVRAEDQQIRAEVTVQDTFVAESSVVWITLRILKRSIALWTGNLHVVFQLSNTTSWNGISDLLVEEQVA
jgi:hypothetical protein